MITSTRREERPSCRSPVGPGLLIVVAMLLVGSQLVQTTTAAATSSVREPDDAVFPQLHIDRNWRNPDIARRAAARFGPPEAWEERLPLSVVNLCSDTIWPGIFTQGGTGPGTGGFELAAGGRRDLWVDPNWSGRVWGRTNCTTGDGSAQCSTGDCWGRLDCDGATVSRQPNLCFGHV